MRGASVVSATGGNAKDTEEGETSACIPARDAQASNSNPQKIINRTMPER